jgi:hypothetical protein
MQLRLDSAHDARDNRDFMREQEQANVLVKRNPRNQDPLAYADKTEAQKARTLDRHGKIEAILSETIPDEPCLRWIFQFGRHCPDFAVYRDLYRGLASSG